MYRATQNLISLENSTSGRWAWKPVIDWRRSRQRICWNISGKLHLISPSLVKTITRVVWNGENMDWIWSRQRICWNLSGKLNIWILLRKLSPSVVVLNGEKVERPCFVVYKWLLRASFTPTAVANGFLLPLLHSLVYIHCIVYTFTQYITTQLH